MDAVGDASAAAPAAAEPRQRNAADGKKLPAGDADRADKSGKGARRHIRAATDPATPVVDPAATAIAATSSDDGDDASADSATSGEDSGTTPSSVAFFAAPAAPILIDPAKLPATMPVGGGSAIAAAMPQVAPPAIDPSLSATPTAATAKAPVATAAFPAAFELLDAGMPVKTATAPVDPTGVTAPRIEAHTDTPRFAIASAAATTDPAALAVQPARQAFATALAALAMPVQPHDDDGGDSPLPLAGLVAPAADPLLRSAVQQAAAGGQAALDPRQDRGLHGMIDHIEMLRDDANARDTRIRLAPDALGTVDVALRRDGDAVHVRFSSVNEATRLVLGDAQPRLAALAEARGVRIAGSSIDGGAGDPWGHGGQPQPQPRAESSRPARAPRTATATDTDMPTDQRLA